MDKIKVFTSTVYAQEEANKLTRWLAPEVEIVDSILTADVVLFKGGADISPDIYNNKRLTNFTRIINHTRDMVEVEHFQEAVKHNKFIIGICRGAQLTCALSGGYLIQHVTNHVRDHKVVLKDPIIPKKYHQLLATSTHHQMMYPYNINPQDYDLYAWATKLSTTYTHSIPTGEFNRKMIEIREPEVVYFKKTKALAIQAHPEFVVGSTNYSYSHRRYVFKLRQLFKKLYVEHKRQQEANRTRCKSSSR